MPEKKFKPERTMIAIKSESIQRHLIGEFISKFEKRGLKMVACKLIAPNSEFIGKHYADDEEWYLSSGTKTRENYASKGEKNLLEPIEYGKLTREKLMDSLRDRPILAMIWEGPHAVALGRKTAGATNPLSADIGSIRGDYSSDSYEMSDETGRAIQSLVHASGSVEEAEREIALWFSPSEIINYDLVMEDVFYTKEWGRVKR
ncbi:MAG: nucleoside-diphosphate kinase [Candidatus Berkelbacteria bacterium Athens1014_28]|uniref:nucleoside-diphosphate kinase n=1 Tax=Candidatus Berkelbacteria bacterium Athens1014_28 TaxID=2017145 RepID=A0A554LKR1_9BACT|nr:MAG: nucleoside-diphosphate kinase [Candidatus Berkelbacteria bacterium Athens1014_28]